MVTIKKDGYIDLIKSVTITDSTVTPVTFSLMSTEEQNRLPGTLSLASTPAGAAVYIDSVVQGSTPLTVTGLAPGVHQVKLTSSGYQDYLGSVALSPGETRTSDIMMQIPPESEYLSASLFPAVLSLLVATLLFTSCRCRKEKK